MNKKFIILGYDVIAMDIARETEDHYFDAKENMFCKEVNPLYDTFAEARKDNLENAKRDLKFYEGRDLEIASDIKYKLRMWGRH